MNSITVTICSLYSISVFKMCLVREFSKCMNLFLCSVHRPIMEDQPPRAIQEETESDRPTEEGRICSKNKSVWPVEEEKQNRGRKRE